MASRRRVEVAPAAAPSEGEADGAVGQRVGLWAHLVALQAKVGDLEGSRVAAG